MAENAKKRQFQPRSSSNRKILRVDSPSFEEEINAFLLALDQSASEDDIDELLVSDRELLQFRDQDDDLEENIPEVDSSNERSSDSSDEGSTSSRRTRRWPMVVFYRIVDLSGINDHVLYNMHQPNITDKGDFLKSLARSLVIPQMQRRVVCSQLPSELRLVIKRLLGEDMVEEDIQRPETSQGKRRACSICPPKLHRMTVYTCVGCCNPICLQCSRPLCKNYQ